MGHEAVARDYGQNTTPPKPVRPDWPNIRRGEGGNSAFRGPGRVIRARQLFGLVVAQACAPEIPSCCPSPVVGIGGATVIIARMPAHLCRPCVSSSSAIPLGKSRLFLRRKSDGRESSSLPDQRNRPGPRSKILKSAPAWPSRVIRATIKLENNSGNSMAAAGGPVRAKPGEPGPRAKGMALSAHQAASESAGRHPQPSFSAKTVDNSFLGRLRNQRQG